MGVQSLWPILSPSARPTPLPTLNRKRLAIDASIWIYQFLKAVRDKEGNALRNSHVVGFFRRICKLLHYGIKPVFVFDGGAPILKRQTVLGRKRRREGRRDDAVRTAGRILAVQMKRRVEEEEVKRKEDGAREKEGLGRREEDDEDVVKEGADLVYVGEMGMSATERQQTRKFRKTDQYHLPELAAGIEGMGQPNDPRIMSAEELEEYARQFHNGEDVNLYDFSKIDFNGEFFMSLPAGDRYNILNAARLRSRLRMGLSKVQLEEMFPDRMEFSRFQIERVRERNELTQRLMNLNGMNDLPGVGGGRIAGERGREYVLVKNDGVEGGWALGVVSGDKRVGEREKPIDVDAMDRKVKEADSEEEDEFEDVPVEGLNRLPKAKQHPRAQDFVDERRKFYETSGREARGNSEEQDSLFVGDGPGNGRSNNVGNASDEEADDLARAIAMSLQQDDVDEEADHVKRAIELSLQKNHKQDDSDDDADFEDVVMPEYEQRAVQAQKPILTSNGKMVAHIVNNRANAAVPKRKAVEVNDDSDEEIDMQAALAKARRQKAPDSRPKQPAPVSANIKNPFDGPLPFEKLNFKSSLFGKKAPQSQNGADEAEDEDDTAGGFDLAEEEAPRPLPPWLAGGGDIRSQVAEQQKQDQELNAEDREKAEEDARMFRKENEPIEIDSSDDYSDVEILDKPPTPKAQARKSISPIVGDVEILDEPPTPKARPRKSASPIVGNVDAMDDIAEIVRAVPPVSGTLQHRKPSVEREVVALDERVESEEIEWSESDYGENTAKSSKTVNAKTPSAKAPSRSRSASVEPGFEDVEMDTTEEARNINPPARSPSPLFEDVDMPDSTSAFPSQPPSNSNPPNLQHEDSLAREQAELDAEFDISDPEEEEAYLRIAMEFEENGQFTDPLNDKPGPQTREEEDKLLRQLRAQQKKDRRDADDVTIQMNDDVKQLIGMFGLPYITAPMEAEAQCAELVRLGLVDGVVTDDCDVFLFGGTRVYKNLFNANKFVECYLSSDIEKELSLSRDQLIALAQLLGSDYTEGLAGIGPVQAVEILSEFPDADGLSKFKEWWLGTQHNGQPAKFETTPFRKKFKKSQATKLFLPPGFPSPAVSEAYWKPDVDSSMEPFMWGVPDLANLRSWLMDIIGWSEERVDEILVPVIQDMNRREQEGTQANITRFFQGAVGAGANGVVGRERAVGSKRMKDAVGRLKSRRNGGREGSVLGRTFADEARDWTKKNDIGWTEREQEKHARKSGKGRGKGRGKRSAPEPAVEEESAGGEGMGEVEPEAEAEVEADDESGSGDEYRDVGRTSGKTGRTAKRKKTKA